MAAVGGELGIAAVRYPVPAKEGASDGGGIRSPWELTTGIETASGAGGPPDPPLDGVVELLPKRGADWSALPGRRAWLAACAVAVLTSGVASAAVPLSTAGAATVAVAWATVATATGPGGGAG